MKEEESDEEHANYDNRFQVQSVANQVWHDKWKHAVKNSIRNKEGTATSNENGEDAIPPLVPLSQTNIRDYAVQKGLLRNGVAEKHGRRGPTGKSKVPTPIWGML